MREKEKEGEKGKGKKKEKAQNWHRVPSTELCWPKQVT